MKPKFLLTADRSTLEFIAPGDLRVDERFAATLPKPENLDAIREDVRKRGILVPLFATRDKLLLDGHTRLDLARELEIAEVPVICLPFDSDEDWAKTVQLATNAHRRHLNAAQRAQLITSLEKVERQRAKERCVEAGSRGGRAGGRGNRKGSGKGSPTLLHDDEEGRATARAAKAAGISRKTYERTKRVATEAPDVAQKMLLGEISVASAYKTVQERSKRAETAALPSSDPEGQAFREISDAPQRRYQCLYADPPWEELDRPPVGGEGRVITEGTLGALPITDLMGPIGAHVWLWAPWRVIRTGAVHRVLDDWGLRWSSELVWHKGEGGGRWLRESTEVLILATYDRLQACGTADGFTDVRADGGTRPEEIRSLIEKFTAGPRIEIFSKQPRPGWDAVEIASLREGGPS